MKQFCTFFLAVFCFQALGGSGMLTIGSTAPQFACVSSNGDTVKLVDFRGKKNVVLVFYPGDQTPGCTKQLCALRDEYSKFDNKETVIFGVNPADARSHKKFIEKRRFPFALLADANRTAAKLYGANGLFIKRTVYVIDKKGVVVFAKRGMPSVAEILAAIP
jgi:peroxiredoxin Q/BCP